MQFIFNQQFFAETMTEMNYDADKLPLGYVIFKGFYPQYPLSCLSS